MCCGLLKQCLTCSLCIVLAIAAMMLFLNNYFVWSDSAAFFKVAELVKKEFGDPNMVICSSYDFAKRIKVGTILKGNYAQKNPEYVHAELTIGQLLQYPDFKINTTKSEEEPFKKIHNIVMNGLLQLVDWLTSRSNFNTTLNIESLEHFSESLDLLSLENYLEKSKLVSEEVKKTIRKVAGSRPSADEDRKHLVVVSNVLFTRNITVSYETTPANNLTVEWLKNVLGLIRNEKGSQCNKRQDPIARCYEVKKLFANNHTGDKEGDCFLSISQKDDSMLIAIDASGVRFVEASIEQDAGAYSWTAVVVWPLVLIVVSVMIILVSYYICYPPRVPQIYKEAADDINKWAAIHIPHCTGLTVCEDMKFTSTLQVGTILQARTADGRKTFRHPTSKPGITLDQMTKDKLPLKIDKSDSWRLDDTPMTGKCLAVQKLAIWLAACLRGVKPTTCFTDTLNDAFHDLEDRKLNSGKAKDVIKWTYHKVAPSLRNRCLCVVTKVLYAENLHFGPETQATPNAGQSRKDKNTSSRYAGMTKQTADEEKDTRIAISFEVQELLINTIDYSFEAVEEGGFNSPPSNTSPQDTAYNAATSATEETDKESIENLGTAQPVHDDKELKGNDVTEDESAAEGRIADSFKAVRKGGSNSPPSNTSQQDTDNHATTSTTKYPQATGLQAADPVSTGPEAAGIKPTGLQDGGTELTGPQATDPQAACTQANTQANTQPAGPQSGESQYVSTQATNTQSTDPQATDPQAAGTQATNTSYTSPQATDPQDAGTQATSAQSTVPQSTPPSNEADSDISDVEDEGYLDFSNTDNVHLRLDLKPCTKQSVTSLYLNSDQVYKMEDGVRGRALIFNNRMFRDNLKIRRSAADVDFANVKRLFEEMNFEITEEDLTDLTAEEMLKEIQEETTLEVHNSYSMFVIVISSHGKFGDRILCQDNKYVDLSTITDLLSASKFPAMKGKPKLVIVQANSGGNEDYGDARPRNSDSSVLLDDDEKNAPTDDVTTTSAAPTGDVTLDADDFFIMKSGTESFKSIRTSTHGSPFIRILVATFYKHSCHLDLETLFKIIQQRVGRSTITMRRRDGQWLGGNVPEGRCTFTNHRKLYFFPNYPPRNSST